MGTPDPKQQNNDPPEEDEATKSFWDRLGKLIDERIDAGVDRTLQKYSKTGQSRNGGRTSLPQMLADVMGGPFKRVE